jgi:hypothetical protein
MKLGNSESKSRHIDINSEVGAGMPERFSMHNVDPEVILAVKSEDPAFNG